MAEVSHTQAVIDECLPLIRLMAQGRYAITIGGSRGKRIADNRSDIDFRLFAEDFVGGAEYSETEAWRQFCQVVERWRAQGIEIDYCWNRTIAEIDQQLDGWVNGVIQPIDLVWAIWGYHLLTDLSNQVVIEDPTGLIAGWQARLTPYPPALRRAIIQKHMESLNYWRNDYHYRSKVERGDVVFLAGISSRLVHDMLQVLFAINETYFVGDGNNLKYVANFARKPERFAERAHAVLYPATAENAFSAQYTALMELIDEVAQLATT